MLVSRAKQYLDGAEAGMGFDEVPVPDGNGDYVPRDVPMTAARHAALAICSSMNVRFNIGEKVEEGPDRNDIVDELTSIIQLASGPGPFDINVALALNETHRTAELENNSYGVEFVDKALTAYSENNGVKSAIYMHQADVNADVLYSAVKTNLENLKIGKGKK